MKSIPRITETEWELMQIAWSRGPATAQEIFDALVVRDASWHPKTARTLLNRLVKKKALGYRKEGRTYVYRPLVTEGDCVGAESTSFLDRVFGGSLKPMLAHFVEREKLTLKEINELKALLERSEGK